MSLYISVQASALTLTNGAAALCISGSGSTLLSVVRAEEAETFAAQMEKGLADSVYGWRCARTSRARGCWANEEALAMGEEWTCTSARE